MVVNPNLDVVFFYEFFNKFVIIISRFNYNYPYAQFFRELECRLSRFNILIKIGNSECSENNAVLV